MIKDFCVVSAIKREVKQERWSPDTSEELCIVWDNGLLLLREARVVTGGGAEIGNNKNLSKSFQEEKWLFRVEQNVKENTVLLILFRNS